MLHHKSICVEQFNLICMLIIDVTRVSILCNSLIKHQCTDFTNIHYTIKVVSEMRMTKPSRQ